MDETENAPENTTETPAPAGDSAASAAGKEAANQMKAEAQEAVNKIKGAGIAGLLGFNVLYFPIIVKVLWILAIVGCVLGGLAMIVMAFLQSVVGGIISIVMTPILMCVILIQIRVWMECMVVAFRINDGIQQLNEKMK